MKDKIIKLWKSFKDWLIDKLGGFTSGETEFLFKMGYEDYLRRYNAELKNTLLQMSIKTAWAEVKVNTYSPYESFDKLKGRARKDIVKQLGEAVYPYAKHFIGDDVYIVALNVQEESFEDCP